MMRIFLNALGASTSSGLTYLRNVLPLLNERGDVHTTVAVNACLRAEFSSLFNITIAKLNDPPGTARRFWFEQTRLPLTLREDGYEVLIATGNFALRRSPIPQILLSGNSLYVSGDFYRDLLHRREYRMWVDSKLKAEFARRSVQWADCTVAPTQAFAQQLQNWAGKTVIGIHHGFDPRIFFTGARLPEDVSEKLQAAEGDLRLLHVSHYNYFRNFETVFRALPLIQKQLGSRRVRLFITCKLLEGSNPGSYSTRAALSLAQQLGIRDNIVELGPIDYSKLHHLYRACDVYVTASYAETFAHPLAEAMACGLRIVASDLPVHREVCGGSARYFPRFCPEALAQRVLEAASSERPKPQTELFSWRQHVEKLLTLARELAYKSGPVLQEVACSSASNPGLSKA